MTPEFIQLSSIDQAKIPPRKWTIENFLQCGQVTLLDGVQTSLFALNVAAAVAAGKAFAWFKAPEKPRTVLILSGRDDPQEIWCQVAAYCAGAGIDLDDLGDRLKIYSSTYICLAEKHGLDVKGTALATALHERIREEDAGLLVIAPLSKTGRGFNEKSRSDMDALLTFVRDLVAGTECAALVVDHYSYGGEAVRGTVNSCRCIATLSSMPVLDFEEYRKAGYTETRDRFFVFRTVKLNYGQPTGDPILSGLMNTPLVMVKRASPS